MDPLWILVKRLWIYKKDTMRVMQIVKKKFKFFETNRNLLILGLFLTLEDRHCIPVLEEDVPSHTWECEE
jgi:hypothetical protein